MVSVVFSTALVPSLSTDILSLSGETTDLVGVLGDGVVGAQLVFLDRRVFGLDADEPFLRGDALDW